MTPSPTESADLVLLTEQIEQDLLPALRGQAARFPSVERLVERYEGKLQRLLEKGWDFLEAFEEAHNELCVAALILDDPAKLLDGKRLWNETDNPKLSKPIEVDPIQ